MSAVVIWDNFSFAYPHQQPLFDPISLTVNKGDFIVISGEVGSGKSTLLRSLVPAISPLGEVKGHAWVEPARESRTLTSAYVSQHVSAQMVCDTVVRELAFGLENLGVSPDVMQRRIAEIVQFFGIEALLHRHVQELSGGQQALVQIAAALVLRPSVLLVDEPTAQLDPVSAQAVLHALFRVNREANVTVILATHEVHEVAPYAHKGYRLSTVGLVPFDLSCVPRGFLPAKEIPEHTLSELHEREQVVRVKQSYFRYDTFNPWVIKGANLTIQRGEIRALIGGNGSGKSTLLSLIAQSVRPHRGKVKNALFSRQALLPQDPQALFACDTVQEELEEWMDRAGYSASDVQSIQKRMHLEGLSSVHPSDLSGGEAQMVALAKLIVTRPSLLLLDEPSKGLDVSKKCLVARILYELAQAGTTIVFATHDLSFAACVANRVSLLFDGMLAATDFPRALFAENLLYCPPFDDFAIQMLSIDCQSVSQVTTSHSLHEMGALYD